MALSASRRLLAGSALLSLAVCAPSAAAAQAPTLRVHPIFSGGAKAVHAGAVVDVDAKGPAPKITKVCLTPAPIDRPSCSGARFVAPSQAGTTKIDVTFADGTTSSMTLRVHAPATRIGGPAAVPGHIGCDRVTVYGNYDTKTRHFHDRITSLKRDANVALYNRLGKDALFVWNYATNKAGFVKVGCAKAGLVPA
jgi:hypothetical protein